MPDITVQFDTQNVFIADSTETITNFIAGFISNNGLVYELGNATEREQGYINIQGSRDLYGRLTDNNFSGPTGGWSGEFFAVNNCLQYGTQVIICGTGENQNTTSPVQTMKSPDLLVSAIFGAKVSDNKDLIEIASERQDCVAVCAIGVTQDIGTDITRVDAPLATDGDKYTFYVAGSKYHLKDNSLALIAPEVSELQLTPLSADAVGCFARTSITTEPWSSPAGLSRGRLLSVVRLEQVLTKSSSDTLYANKINPTLTLPGEGTFLFGDKTHYQPNTENSNFAHVNVTNLIIYMNRVIGNVALEFLFELNDEANRSSFLARVTPILRRILNSGGITEFSIVCDETNNTPSVISAGNFVADILVKPAKSIQSIQLRFTNVPETQSIISGSPENEA